MPAIDHTDAVAQVAEHPGMRPCSGEPRTQRVISVRAPISVLLVDPSSKAAPTLWTALQRVSTLKMISEAELDQDEQCSKITLVFVQETAFTETLSLINRLKIRFPTLRVLVAFQVLNRAGLPLFGGPGAKLVHRRSRDDGGASERR